MREHNEILPPPAVSIEFEDNFGTVSFDNLRLTPKHPDSPIINIFFEKQPLFLEVGRSYEFNQVVVDVESKKMLETASKAEELREIPEKERLKPLLELLGKNIHYAYRDVMEDVAKKDPDLAAWVAENSGLDAPIKKVNLSDIFEKGYGICKHLHVAYLYLAQKAGLRGTLLSTVSPHLKNIVRPDTGGPLFRSVPIGEPVGAHAWDEILLSDGRWIPVDPSTQLVGDTTEGLQMFTDAHYEAPSENGAEVGYGPFGKGLMRLGRAAIFKPGESIAKGEYRLALQTDLESSEVLNERMFSGNAKIEIRTLPRLGSMNLKIKEISLPD